MKKFKTNPYRLFFQFSIIGLLVYMGIRFFIDKNYFPDYEAYCPFGGVQALSSYFVNNSLACSMTSAQIVMGLTLIVLIIIVSKLFCSYVCPIGTLSEWLGRLGERFKMRTTLTGKLDKVLRILKYTLLFITIYFTVTSSELFCKKFDPYYATVTGFGSDVSIVMGIIALVLVVVGSFYIRLFWCKYVCPLGAISNIFRFFLVFIGIIVAYIAVLLLGMKLSFIWVLAALCIVAYVLELLSINNKVFPLLKITRNPETCTNCSQCSNACPQAIDVAALDKVNHTDCNLCGDCIQACPEKNTLTINRKGKKWLPALILLLLIIIGIIVGSTFEVPTISEYWGDATLKPKMKVYEQSGLKNIKCFGSSTSFAKKMKKVKGVTGVSTYVSSHSVKVWYDPSILDTLGLKKSIFVPVKVALAKQQIETDSIAVYYLNVDHFFDPYDTYYLTTLLQQNHEIFGFTTEYDCPVKVTVYVSKDITAESIKTLIEQKQVKITYSDNTSQNIELNYKVSKIEKTSHSISEKDFTELMKSK